jgi:hypothetical protein
LCIAQLAVAATSGLLAQIDAAASKVIGDDGLFLSELFTLLFGADDVVCPLDEDKEKLALNPETSEEPPLPDVEVLDLGVDSITNACARMRATDRDAPAACNCV